MNTSQLFNKFSYAINWNALLYLVYKTSFILRSFLLYKYLNTNDFSIWANLNSIIFLLLLWLDCGFRKSIPRFIPEFEKNQNDTKTFIHFIILIQSCTLLIGVPLFFYWTKSLLKTIPTTESDSILFLGVLIFFTEGLIAVTRLIYHAQFLNKEFNLIATIIVITQTTIDIAILGFANTSTTIFICILCSKLSAGICIVITMITIRYKIYDNRAYTTINNKTLKKNFITHSGIMWINNNLKSFSERNFLVPFLTYTLGPDQANVFKIANDAALFFYRIVLKTIGTTDTTLLSHIEVGEQKNLITIAFTKLTMKIVGLCIPLLGVVVFCGIHGNQYWNDKFVFQAFIIMALGYLIETLFLPYERILEVKRQYRYLCIAYIPYICMVIFFITGYMITSIGLLDSIILIHIVRLVSLGSIIYFARTRYPICFPISYTIKVSMLSLITLFLLYCLTLTLGHSLLFNPYFSKHSLFFIFWN